MFHRFRPVLGLLAIAGLVVAGCGGSSGTPTPPPISDPNEIMTRSISAAADTKSFHFRAELSGKVNLASLGESAGGLSGTIDLGGTYAEGDVDVKNKAGNIKFGMPGLLGLSGEIIAVDGYMYTKISLQGDKYTKSKLDESLPVDIPSPEASASNSIASQVEELRKSLQEAGATTTLKADEKVDGKDCYHVSVAVPPEKINDLLTEAGESAAGTTIESMTIEYWVYKENVRPAKVTLGATVASVGTVTLNIVISKYDQSVTVKAPYPSQVEEASAE